MLYKCKFDICHNISGSFINFFFDYFSKSTLKFEYLLTCHRTANETFFLWYYANNDSYNYFFLLEKGEIAQEDSKQVNNWNDDMHKLKLETVKKHKLMLGTKTNKDKLTIAIKIKIQDNNWDQDKWGHTKNWNDDNTFAIMERKIVFNNFSCKNNSYRSHCLHNTTKNCFNNGPTISDTLINTIQRKNFRKKIR